MAGWTDHLSPEALRFMLESPAPFMPVVEDVYSIGSRRKWFVIYTAAQAQEKTVEGLEAKGFVNYSPMEYYWKPPTPLQERKGGHKTRAWRPLLPRYVFAQMPIAKDGSVPFETVRAIDGVESFVKVSGFPITIADTDIELLKSREEAGEFDETFTQKIGSKTITSPKWVKLGAKVRPKSGPFAGFVSLIEEILPQNRLKIAVSIFGRETPVEMDLAQIERCL